MVGTMKCCGPKRATAAAVTTMPSKPECLVVGDLMKSSMKMATNMAVSTKSSPCMLSITLAGSMAAAR